MHFDPNLVDRYTLEELAAFIINGEVSFDYLIEIGLHPSKCEKLKADLEEYEKIIKAAEENDWKSVSYSLNLNYLRKFLWRYPNSSHAAEARYLIKRLEIKEEESHIAYYISFKEPKLEPERRKNTYIPQHIKDIVKSFWNKHSNKPQRFEYQQETLCNSAVFAPGEIARGDDMLVQVYIYKDEERDQVVIDSKMSDQDAIQRSYTPLYFPLKKGDVIKVTINMYGFLVLGESAETIVWQNKYTKCCFFVNIPLGCSKYKVMGDVFLSVNGLELGKMTFFSRITDKTDISISSETVCTPYKKIFISYSHKDDKTVNAIAEAYKALGIVDYFYDRHSLTPGDLFEKKIFEFIDNCDVFLLCWSKNAEESEWVKKERVHAFCGATDIPPKLRLYPINIPPYAPPPPDFYNLIHFVDYDKLLDLKSEN